MTKKQNPNRIAELRQRSGLNQAELAERLGVHWVTVSKLERGVMKLTQEWMMQISAALKVHATELITDAPAVRTIHVQGHVSEHGIVERLKEAKGDEEFYHAYDIQIGAKEPEVTTWLFIYTHLYMPFLHYGDVARFSYFGNFSIMIGIGRLCLIDLEDAEHTRVLGILQRGSTLDLYDVQIQGRPTLKDVRVKEVGVMTMAVMHPQMATE